MKAQVDGRRLTPEPAGGPSDLSRCASQPVGAHQAQWVELGDGSIVSRTARGAFELGFTGNRHRPSTVTSQQLTLCGWLGRLRAFGAVWMHNGDCVGWDADAGAMWRFLRGKLSIKPPSIDAKRAFLPADEIAEPKPYLDRNHDIAAAADVLVGVPSEMFEQQRSGTWATIRAARRLGRPVLIVWPNGSYTLERWPDHLPASEARR